MTRSRKSVFVNYLVSYAIAVCVFCLLTYLISTAPLAGRYRAMLTENSRKRCENMSVEIDDEMERIEQIASRVGENLCLSNVNLDSSYDYYMAIRELRKYQAASKYLEDIVLVYRDAPFAISSLSTYRRNRMQNEFGVTEPQMEEVIRALRPALYQTYTVRDGVRLSHLIYMYPMRLATRPRDGVLVFLLNEESVRRDMLAALDVNEGGVFILNEENAFCYSAWTQAGEMPMLDAETREALSARGSLARGEETFLLTTSRHGWRYVTWVSEDMMASSFARLQRALAGVLLLVLCAGMAAAWFLARRAYRPIHSLAESVRDRQSAVPARVNEWTLIEDAFEASDRERRALIGNVQAHGKTLIAEALLSLLRGNTHILENGYLLDALGMTFHARHYLLLLVILDGQASAENRERAAQWTQRHFGAMTRAYCAELSDGAQLIALLNYDDAPRSAFLDAALALQKETDEFTLTLVLGEEYDSLDDTARQREALLNAARHRLVTGENSIIDARRVPAAASGQNSPYSEYDLYLIYKTGERKAVASALRELFDADNRTLTASTVLMEYYKLLGVMQRVNEEAGHPASMADALSRAMSREPETLKTMLETLGALSGELCDLVMRQREQKNSSLRQNVTNYIQTHYTRQDLTQEEIAEAFDVSCSYLSRYFKAQTGESVSAYIDALRMERARRLLRETQATVKEIVSAAGYGDVNHFIRKFRTLYGLTPITYRNTAEQTTQESESGSF